MGAWGRFDARWPIGNGGRHCCQPPLRRAKDLPVFVTWSKTRRPRPALDPGSPAQASLPILQLPLSKSRSVLLDCAARRFAGLSTGPAWHWNRSPGQNHPMFCGPSWDNLYRVPLCSPSPRGGREPRRATGRLSLPAPLPGWPREEPKFFPLPAGGDRTLGHPPHPRTVAGSRGGRDVGPDHQGTMHLSPESQKRNFW